MILCVTFLVVATVAIAALCVAPRMRRGNVIQRLSPDRPHPFGYDMSWIAIRTRDTEAVLDALAVEGETAANWNSGIGTIYDSRLGSEHVFVSPPVGAWTFVVGVALPHPVGADYVDKCTPLLSRLAASFAEVQYFFSYPALDFYSWVRFKAGRLERALASTDRGIVWSKGRLTAAERELGLKHFDIHGLSGRSGDAGGVILMSPTEDHVMGVARLWSLDPTGLQESDAPPALGYIVPAPRAWRTERVRRSAA